MKKKIFLVFVIMTSLLLITNSAFATTTDDDSVMLGKKTRYVLPGGYDEITNEAITNGDNYLLYSHLYEIVIDSTPVSLSPINQAITEYESENFLDYPWYSDESYSFSEGLEMLKEYFEEEIVATIQNNHIELVTSNFSLPLSHEEFYSNEEGLFVYPETLSRFAYEFKNSGK